MNEFSLTTHGSTLPLDLVTVRRALTTGFDPGESFEIRALPSKASRICSRDNIDEAVQIVESLADSKAIYVLLNPVRPSLSRPASTDDIVRRRCLLIDVDPRRANRDLSATDAEKTHAVELAEAVVTWLTGEGWPEPVVINSGNGRHVRYRIELPNDEPSRRLVRQVLKALAARFDTANAEIDTSVSDAPRPARLPGTWARKGPDTHERPHRMATIVSMPDELAVVPAELLERLVGPGASSPLPATEVETIPAQQPASGSPDGFTLTVGGDERNARYLTAAREREYGRLAMAEPGDRNNALNRAAFALGQFIGAGHLDRAEIEEDLLKLAMRAQLDEPEARVTIRSGIESGITQPRQIPEPSSTVALGADTEKEEWHEPYLDCQPQAAPFPLQVLPGALGELCAAGAESYECPPDFFAVPAVVLAGGVIGMSVNLRMSSNWEIPPHLFCKIVAPPGSKKSPPLELMNRPLADIDQELQEEFRVAMANTLPDDPKPLHRHLRLDDVTRESVAVIHAENPRGLVLVKDEVKGFDQEMNQYRGGRGSDQSFWLSVNSSAPIKVNRKGNNRESYTIPRPCISIIGGMTPSNLGEIRGAGRDDGWLDRFLYSYPDTTLRPREWKSQGVPMDLFDEWKSAIRYLWIRQPESFGTIQRPHLIELDNNALDVWKDWYREHWKQASAPDFAPELRGPWSKLEGFTARFALILSQLHQAYIGQEGPPRDVDALDMHHARLLSDYFKRHLERALHGINRQEIPDVARLLIRKLVEEKIREFSGRLLTRNYSNYIREPADLENTLIWLERHNIIRPKNPAVDSIPKRRGRPAGVQFLVNPRLFADSADFADRLLRS
jgi:hypothetical protein